MKEGGGRGEWEMKREWDKKEKERRDEGTMGRKSKGRGHVQKHSVLCIGACTPDKTGNTDSV